MLCFNLHQNLFRRGAFRQKNLHVNVLDWLAPVVLFSLPAVIRTNFLIDYLQRCRWLWDIVSFYCLSLHLLLLNNWFNLFSLWLVFGFLNFIYSFIFSLILFDRCFQLRFFCIFLELIPTLCKSVAFWWELFLMLILVLLVKLIDLKWELDQV